MKLKSLSVKIVSTTAVGVILVVSVLIILSTKVLRDKMIETGQQKQISIAYQYAQVVKSNLELSFALSKSTAQAMEQHSKFLQPEKALELLEATLLENPYLRGVSLIIDTNKIAIGMFDDHFFIDPNGFLVSHICLDNKRFRYVDKNKTQFSPFKNIQLVPIQQDSAKIMIINSVAPVFADGELVANVTYYFDFNGIESDSLNSMFDNQLDLDILTDNGTYAYSSKQMHEIGLSIKDSLENREKQLETIRSAKNKQFEADGFSQVFVPIIFMNEISPWQVRVLVPMSVITKEATQSMLQKAVMGFSVSALIIILVFLRVRKLLRPMIPIKAIAEKVAYGDLTDDISIKTNDELQVIGDAFQNVIEQMRVVATALQQSANQIKLTGYEISNSANHVAVGASEQATTMEEISSSMEEMVANINNNLTNASITALSSNKTVDEIDKVMDAFESTSAAINEITQKIEIINEIAERTDLLAINAAIEAARAGESGKGFTVVASEIRKLAEKSMLASSTINELSASNIKIADASLELLQKTVPDIQSNARKVSEITTASSEQNIGASQISNAIIQLDNVIQDNASSAEELATSADVFKALSKELIEIASFFKLR